jgi:uncharacterized protein YjbI with pentapeptide repeats
MANKEHFELFMQGAKVWNEWRSSRDLRNGGDGTLIFPDLSEVNFSGYYDGFDLSSYDFTETNLSGTYLYEADLSESRLWGANLSEANLGKANLSKANLIGTKLRKAILNDAILNVADLIEADLSEAELVRTQALRTNFERAIFTGACIEDWNINSATNLNGVICHYIYLKAGQGVLPLVNPQERRPSSGNFAPGEFTKLLQKARETVDLIFRQGVDWAAFLTSFQKLQVECGSDELFIQAFEKKGDAFVIRVSVPSGADKAEIEKYLKRQYELEAKLQAKDELLADYRHQNANLRTDLLEITKLLASRPINVNQSGSSIGIGYSETVQTDKLGGIIHTQRVTDESC